MFTRAKSALADVQVVFERHKTFISISATVLSSLAAWAGYTARVQHQKSLEEKLHTLSTEIGQARTETHRRGFAIFSVETMFTAAAAAGVGYMIGRRQGRLRAMRTLRSTLSEMEGTDVNADPQFTIETEPRASGSVLEGRVAQDADLEKEIFGVNRRPRASRVLVESEADVEVPEKPRRSFATFDSALSDGATSAQVSEKNEQSQRASEPAKSIGAIGDISQRLKLLIRKTADQRARAEAEAYAEAAEEEEQVQSLNLGISRHLKGSAAWGPNPFSEWKLNDNVLSSLRSSQQAFRNSPVEREERVFEETDEGLRDHDLTFVDPKTKKTWVSALGKKRTVGRENVPVATIPVSTVPVGGISSSSSSSSGVGNTHSVRPASEGTDH